MRSIIISPNILEKLKNEHDVTRREVEQCFENRIGTYLEDPREEHYTDPATLWFVSQTNQGRTLKVALVFADGNIHIKSAYEPNQSVVDIYDRDGK